jgi:hypothetical protein
LLLLAIAFFSGPHSRQPQLLQFPFGLQLLLLIEPLLLLTLLLPLWLLVLLAQRPVLLLLLLLLLLLSPPLLVPCWLIQLLRLQILGGRELLQEEEL